MFNGCSQLSSLILTNFKTSSVTTMSSMFASCSSLFELDLSNFNISKVSIMQNMFKDCIKLQYINLNNSIENKENIRLEGIFDSIPINVVICIKEDNTKIKNSIPNIGCSIINCSDDWKKHQKKIIFGTGQCVNNCNETENNKYEIDNICYEEYNNETYFNSESYIGELRNSISLISSEINYINETSNLIKDSLEKINEYVTAYLTQYLNYINNNSKIMFMHETDNIAEPINYINGSSNIVNINNSFKIINSCGIDYNFNRLSFDSTIINYNQNKYYYDYSSSFIDSNNSEILNRITDYIKDYSLTDNKNIIIKGESDFIYQITTTDKEKELINKNISHKDYNISIIDFSEC